MIILINILLLMGVLSLAASGLGLLEISPFDLIGNQIYAMAIDGLLLIIAMTIAAWVKGKK